MASSMTSLPAGDCRPLDSEEEIIENSLKVAQLIAVGPQLSANQAFKEAVEKMNLSVCISF